VFETLAVRRQRESGLRLGVCAAPLLAALLGACSPQPEPRSVTDFMDDGFARDGVLTRCNRDRDATLADEECANARRAAAARALEAERARAPALEQESEAKLLALREREARPDATSSGPAFGSPVGSVLPSMARAPAFDVYADGSSDALGRPGLEIEQAAPPANELVIETPRLETTDLTVVPRPFPDAAAL